MHIAVWEAVAVMEGTADVETDTVADAVMPHASDTSTVYTPAAFNDTVLVFAPVLQVYVTGTLALACTVALCPVHNETALGFTVTVGKGITSTVWLACAVPQAFVVVTTTVVVVFTLRV